MKVKQYTFKLQTSFKDIYFYAEFHTTSLVILPWIENYLFETQFLTAPKLNVSTQSSDIQKSKCAHQLAENIKSDVVWTVCNTPVQKIHSRFPLCILKATERKSIDISINLDSVMVETLYICFIWVTKNIYSHFMSL